MEPSAAKLNQMTFKLVTLHKRAEFLRVRGGGRAATPRFVLEGKRRFAIGGRAIQGIIGPAAPRFGFTVTKQMGNAVTRNRIKRRLRAALADVAATLADANFDYVIIARRDAHQCDYKMLVDDFVSGFWRVHRAPPPSKPRTTRPDQP